ncbi:MAG: 2-C-methyl-D-erythritol 4-phosphate cytidylyltransferase [Planctomycetota bacterium]
MSPRDVGIVIPAAGSGTRFGAKKQFLELAGRPMLHHSLDLFASLEGVAEVVIVGAESDLETLDGVIDTWRTARQSSGVSPDLRTVRGGARRQDSVENGIRALGGSVEVVLVHDAARPLLTSNDARAVVDNVREHGAAVLGYPATDSVKEERDGAVERGLVRDLVWLVQTPQGARRELLERAYREVTDGLHTDEVSLLSGIDVRAKLVEGSRQNMKVTLPGDLELAEFLLSRR